MARTAASIGPRAWTRAGVEDDIIDLRQALASHPFPTDQDHLIARCVARRSPVRLMWRLSCLSRTRSYASLDEVCVEICRCAGLANDPTAAPHSPAGTATVASA